MNAASGMKMIELHHPTDFTNPKRGGRKYINRLTAIALLTTVIAGCKTVALPQEVFVHEGITGGAGAPDWVEGKLEAAVGKVRFVGRGGGYDVLDERAAFDEAMAHAHTQLAGYVSTKVVAKACTQDASFGTRFLQSHSQFAGTGEVTDQSLKTCAHQISEALVGGLVAADQHWERWQVQTRRSVHEMLRYKCWVLCEVDRADVDRYVEAGLAALINEDALREAKAILAANALEHTRLEANVGLAAGDLEQTRAHLEAQIHHNRLLSERIYYGRRFRLVAKEDCLHYPATCAHQAEHPEWRVTEVVTRHAAVPIVVTSCRAVEAEAGCQGCSNCRGGL